MNKKFNFLLIGLFLSFSMQLIATDIDMDSLGGSVITFWDDTNGLPSNRILDVIQDNTGYIWLASYEGLIRFNGRDFIEISENEYGFTGTSPRVLCKGSNNEIWIGTNSSGLFKYQNKKFKNYTLDAGLPDLSVRAITYDNSGKLWVGTAAGIAFFDKANDRDKFKAINDNNLELGIISFLLPVNNAILAGSNLHGLKIIKDNTVQNFDAIPELKGHAFSTAYNDTDGSIWLGTSDGRIFKIKDEKLIAKYEFKDLAGIRISKFLRARSGHMYIATDNGIIKLRKNKIANFEEHLLKKKNVSSIYQDVEGNLWIGMERDGIGKFTKGKFLDLHQSKALLPEAVNSVLEDSEKNIWIAKDNGIICLLDENISVERKEIINNLLKKLKGLRVRQIREENGALIFSTYSKYGLLFLRKNGSIKTINQKDGLANNKVRFSYRDKNGLLWIGTSAGPAIHYKNRTIKLNKDNGLSNLFILSCTQDSQGNIWLGSDGGGVAKISTKNLKEYFEDRNLSNEELKNKIKVEKNYTVEDGLSGNIVLRILEDTLGSLWFCTGTGLTLLKNGKFYPANKSLAYGNTSIFDILNDNAGNLWIVAPKELILVRSDIFYTAVTTQNEVRNIEKFNRLDGLPGQLAANSWGHINKNNKLFIPTLKGVSICDPNYDTSNKVPPPVVIESIIIDDKVYNGDKEKITIPAKTKRIAFQFTALSFTIPQRVEVQYKLQGYDTKWKSSGTNRVISYTNLQPGNYTFQVRAINNDGVINMNGCSVAFYKKPLFHQTIWFYIILLVILTLFIYLIMQLRLRNLKKHAAELNVKVKEKTKELEKEKERADKLLKNTLPLSIIDELINTGKVEPKTYPAVSVLFADLVGFTQWASGNTPETIISELNKLFTHFDTIMDKFGCERIKTLGDGYMACCGLQGEKDHAEKLVSAAVEMLNSLDRLNKEINQTVQIKIGISSGTMTGGIVGIHKYIFDVFGDVVNTTFRLESAGIPMSCTLSEKTAELIKGKFKVYKRPKRELKGKGLVDTYYLLYKDESENITYENINSNYNSILNNFENKKYEECTKGISKLNMNLLEPEMLVDINSIIEKISTNKN